jgi:tetraprenyl-beta-curcumene synthase
VIPKVAREVAFWRRRAREIPDPTLRACALATLRRERLNAEGAALFTTLPSERCRPLLRLLVTFQITLDYLDTISERLPPDSLAHGHQLHRALPEALDPRGPVSDYYSHCPGLDDGGYLLDLVRACRRSCSALPGYRRISDRVLRASSRLSVQVLNHDVVAARRNAALADLAQRTYPGRTEMSWFELTAAASSTLSIYALLALAADPAVGERELAEAQATYDPWVCAACTFLDAFVDQSDDAATGNHSYIAHYPSPEVAAERLREIVYESVSRARRLRRGTRHALIATGMVTMYLSKDSARHPALREDARAILAAAGSLPRVQLPIMRIMRRLHGLRSA